MYLGCLAFIFLLFILVVVSIIGNAVNIVFDIIIYIWDTVCNWFRPRSRRKKTRNPFRPHTDNARTQDHTERPADDPRSSPPGKIFKANDGEYIDFEEI